MISKILRTIIIGPPGSGKGTISERIVLDFGMKHLSSGNILRKQIVDGTAAGMAANKFIENGQLVPDTVMVELIINELKQLENKSWLLDGFPRTLPQAECLYNNEPVDTVINLNVPFEVIIGRIKKRWTHLPSGRIYNTEFNPPKIEGKDDITGEDLVQRDDDKPETVQKRLETFQNLTEPVLEFYRQKNILKEFKGSYSNEIWPKVHGYLSTFTKPLKYTEYK